MGILSFFQSWGVMLYEMIVGKTPFYDGIVDQVRKNGKH